MSSAILYVAIVAIWAAVLMPRWLRTRSADTDSTEAEDTLAPEAAGPDQDGEPATPRVVEWVDDESPWQEGPVWESLTEPAELSDTHTVSAAWRVAAPEVPESTVRPAPARSRDDRKPTAKPAPQPVTASERHPRTLRARRRMLLTLVLLTAVAGALAADHLAALWVVVPPAGILGGFMLLLREAAHSDAERARRRAHAVQVQRNTREAAHEKVTVRPAETAEPPASPAPAPAPAWEVFSGHAEVHYLSAFRRDPQPEPEPMAPVIQISKRIRDGVYDQYEDAAHRAVGD